ncbi:MAG: Crp/Fnr family transcriptional regulator [Candidatus Eisenbacteria bacterium]
MTPGARPSPARSGSKEKRPGPRSIYMLSPLERVRTLLRVEPLGSLSTEEAMFVAQNCEERAFGKGETIFEAGSPPGRFHVVVEGEIAASGVEHGERVLEAGATLGLLTMLSHLPEGLAATARTDARTLEMSFDVLSDVMEDRISILFSLLGKIQREILTLRRHIPHGARLGGEQQFPDLADATRIDLVTRLKALRRTSIFRRAGVGALVQIGASIEEHRVEAGTSLGKPGTRAGSSISS